MKGGSEGGVLLGAIYDAGMDPGQWGTALTSIRQAVGGVASILFHRDSTVSTRHCETIAMSGWTEQDVAPYLQYYGGLDTRIPVIAQTPVGQVYVDDRQMPFRAVASSEIFHDFFRPLGLGQGMATTLFAADSRIGLVSVHRAIDDGGFPAEAVSLFEWLAPHIVRALQVQRQVQRAENIARGMALTLDHFSVAVFLVNGTGMVRDMNCHAAEMLQEPSFPLQVVANRLSARDGRGVDVLREQIACAVGIAGGAPNMTPKLLNFRRRGGTSAVSIMIAPLRLGSQVGPACEPLAAIFLSDPSQAHTLDAPVLMQQFGFTQAEASLASALTQGTSLTEIADTRRVSVETVRTLLKRAMAKTESHSQGQLIGRVSRSLAVLRGHRDR